MVPLALPFPSTVCRDTRYCGCVPVTLDCRIKNEVAVSLFGAGKIHARKLLVLFRDTAVNVGVELSVPTSTGEPNRIRFTSMASNVIDRRTKEMSFFMRRLLTGTRFGRLHGLPCWLSPR